MSTYVVGFRPPDERWQEMKNVWDACRRAGIDVPSDVWSFFNGDPPDDSGVEVPLGKAVEDWGDDMKKGYQVDVYALPKDVRYVRFYNSY